MNLLRRFQISRDRSVTVANLVDELLRRNGDCQVSIEDDKPYRLAELHSDICSIPSFIARSRFAPASPSPFTGPTTDAAFVGFSLSSEPAASPFRSTRSSRWLKSAAFWPTAASKS